MPCSRQFRQRQVTFGDDALEIFGLGTDAVIEGAAFVRHQRDDLAIAVEPAPVAAAADDAQALADVVAMPDTGTRGLGRSGRADLAADAVIGRYLRMAGATGLLDRRPSGDGDGNALELFQEASFRRLVPGIGRCAGSDAEIPRWRG